MYEWIRGPLLWAAFLIFLFGFAYQLVRFASLAPRANGVPKNAPFPKGVKPQQRPFRERLWVKYSLIKTSPLGTHPLLTAVSAIFHVLLFITPLCLLAHNILWYESWGFQLVSFRESTTDLFTVLILGCCAFFLLRRLLDSHARSISSWADYLLLAVITAPFLTGFLAYHQLIHYRAMVIAHILLAEVLIAVVPFTKLMHMFFFFLNRLLMLTDYSYSRARRIL